MKFTLKDVIQRCVSVVTSCPAVTDVLKTLFLLVLECFLFSSWERRMVGKTFDGLVGEGGLERPPSQQKHLAWLSHCSP